MAALVGDGHRRLTATAPGTPLDSVSYPDYADLRDKATTLQSVVCFDLFRAGISPRRLAGALGRARAERLVPAIKDTLTEAIAAGGSSLRDYVQPSGELGYFQHAWKVYDRAGRPCEHCPGLPACGGIKRLVQTGRASFYCPLTQK